MIDRLRSGVAPALACSLLSACSADALPEPDPEILTIGAFVAVEGPSGGGPLSLSRTLDYLKLGEDTIIYLTIYDVAPESYEAARDISKQADIPILVEVATASTREFPANPYRVVWFRTLSVEEQERLE